MAEPGEPLSEREIDVLQSVSSGASNKQIASELSISENTVKVHLRNIYAKLGVSSRTEATTAAITEGYITVPGQIPEPIENTALSTNPIVEDSFIEEVPGEEAKGGKWRIPALILLLVISIIAIIFLSWQIINPTQFSATPEPFEETAIEDTRWLIGKPMSEGRANMAMASVGLDIYQIGGETADGIDGKVRVYNSLDHSWRDAAAKPTAVADASASELFGELYVPGGRLADGQPTANVEAYSPSSDAWRPVAGLPQPISGGLTLSDGAFLYVLGGWNGKEVLDTVYVYDPSANSWRPLSPMPQARAFAAGGFVTGKLVIAGGTDGEGDLATCYKFDPATEEWTGCPDMLLPRAAAGSAVVFNKLYVIGGGLDNNNEMTFSEIYDPDSDTWQVVNTPALEDAAHWPYVGVSNVETRIYALGGRRGEDFLDDMMIYAPLVYQTYIPAAPGDE